MAQHSMYVYCININVLRALATGWTLLLNSRMTVVTEQQQDEEV